MRVIHGVWAHGSTALCLWAEDPDLPPRPAAGAAGRAPGPAASVRLPGRRAGRPAGRSPPGSASTAAGDAVRKAVHDELTLRLPSAGGGPLASPELVRPEAPGDSGCARARALRRLRFRPGAAGCRWRAGGCPCSRSAPAPRWRCWVIRAGRLRPVRRRRHRRRVADLPGRGGAVRGRPGRPRPGAARARVRGRRLYARGGGRCSAVPTRSAPVTWPRPCPRPAGPSPARPRERCSAAPWMPWPTRPRGPG